MKKIIHIDMDCFYAAIEERDNSGLKGMPIAVGGRPDSRGVVAACNYEARKFGVHSAMASSQAKKLCPDLIFIKPRMDIYRAESQVIRKIFSSFTEKVEPLSLDEAYLDVSDCQLYQGSATYLAQAIKHQIHEQTHLTASAGVAPNKFLAKIASDWNKPNGLFVISPEKVDRFVRRLAVSKINGVGKVTARKLADMGVKYCEDLRRYSIYELTENFGVFGRRLYDLCRGIDNREVQSSSIRKSVSVESTYDSDLVTLEECLSKLDGLTESLSSRVSKSKAHSRIRKLSVKMKFSNFASTTVERSSPCIDKNLLSVLTKEAWSRNPKSVRLLGLGVKLKENDSISVEMKQLELSLKRSSHLFN